MRAEPAAAERLAAHGRARAMGVLGLPRVAELGNRLLFAVRYEDRVVAEALASRRPHGDPSLERAGAAQPASVRRKETSSET